MGRLAGDLWLGLVGFSCTANLARAQHVGSPCPTMWDVDWIGGECAVKRELQVSAALVMLHWDLGALFDLWLPQRAARTSLWTLRAS